MDQPNNPTPAQPMPQHVPALPKRSLGALIKKYFLHIIVFFIISITSGVLLANHEANSTANWQTFTSKEAGLSFKHPKAYKIIEDKGWRITVYPFEATPANNIKILYSHQSLNQASAEETFLANCQAKKVSEINANNTRIKVYEDSTCGGQVVENSVIVYSENGMNYDIGLFGQTNRDQLYQFLSTFTFNKQTLPAIPASPIPSEFPEQDTLVNTYTNTKYNYSLQYPAATLLDGNPTSDLVTIDKQITIDVSSKDPRNCRGDCMTGGPNVTDVVINNNPAFKSSGYIGSMNGVPQNYQQVVFPHSGLFYIFTLYELKTDSKETIDRQLKDIDPQAIALFNQILSTVKFTDQAAPQKTVPTINEQPNNGMTMCTMDAKICPDGTTVGRTGPNCEFVCPK